GARAHIVVPELAELHPRRLVAAGPELSADDDGRVVVRCLAAELFDQQAGTENDLDAELFARFAQRRVGWLLARLDLAAGKVEVRVSVTHAADQRDSPLVAKNDGRQPAHSCSRRLSSAAQRESVDS